MVFEKIVVDVLNKYLGDFIENLDSKQLSIGVWGGSLILIRKSYQLIRS